MKKYILFFLTLLIADFGLSQSFDSTDYRIIHLQDTVISGTPSLFFKMTTNTNNVNTGYADFTFIDQNGDSITAPTHWSMWRPESNNPIYDTVNYVLDFKLGINSFPADFDGHQAY